MENPNNYIASFLEICDTIKMNGVSSDTTHLRLFPFSLKDKAKVLAVERECRFIHHMGWSFQGFFVQIFFTQENH